MRKKIAVFVAFVALSTLSFARPASAQTDNQHVVAPITSGPSVDADTTSATIRWHTDRMTTTAVKYGTDQNNLKDERLPGGSRDHKVVIGDLQAGTHYVYQVLDANGSVQKSGDFTTKGSSSASNSGSQSGTSASSNGAVDNVRILDGPRPQNVTPNSATIYWRTDDVAASDVKYGTDQNNLSQRAFERGGSREHTAELTSLQPGQTYYFQILRRDGSVRTSGQFSTPTSSAGSTTPSTNGSQPSSTATVNVNGGPVPQYVNQNTAVISWKTDQQSSSTVKYGTDPNNLSQTATGNWGTNHQVNVQGLQPSTTYYYQVQSSPAEGTGNVATSQTANFQTVAPGQQAKQQARPF
jgi:ABC-type uncharacterized transport system substrate-binding protein